MALKSRKHPLAVMSVAAIALPLVKLGLDPAVAGSVALALLQACGGFALFLFLSRNFFSVLTSALMTLLVYSFFSTVTLLSVTETYGITLSAAAITFLVAGEASRIYGRAPLRAALTAGAVGGLAGWANLPATAFVLAFTGFAVATRHFSGWRSCWYSFVLPAGLAAAIAAIPGIVLDLTNGFAWQAKYVAEYASASNFSDPRVLKDYLVSYFFYPIVSPRDYVQCRFTVSDFSLSDGFSFRVLAACTMLAVLAAGLLKAIWDAERRPLALSIVGMVSIFFVFYLYFNPDEALLYSPQWTLPLIVGSFLGLATFQQQEYLLRAGTAIAIALCLFLNVPPLTDQRTGTPPFCCPNPPATGLRAKQAAFGLAPTRTCSKSSQFSAKDLVAGIPGTEQVR